MYKVLKKDGKVEDFNWQKLISGVMKAGASKEEADKVASEIEIWLANVADGDSKIKSYDLHMKVIEALTKINPAVGSSFKNFRKPEPQP